MCSDGQDGRLDDLRRLRVGSAPDVGQSRSFVGIRHHGAAHGGNPAGQAHGQGVDLGRGRSAHRYGTPGRDRGFAANAALGGGRHGIGHDRGVGRDAGRGTEAGGQAGDDGVGIGGNAHGPDGGRRCGVHNLGRDCAVDTVVGHGRAQGERVGDRYAAGEGQDVGVGVDRVPVKGVIQRGSHARRGRDGRIEVGDIVGRCFRCRNRNGAGSEDARILDLGRDRVADVVQGQGSVERSQARSGHADGKGADDRQGLGFQAHAASGGCDDGAGDGRVELVGDAVLGYGGATGEETRSGQPHGHGADGRGVGCRQGEGADVDAERARHVFDGGADSVLDVIDGQGQLRRLQAGARYATHEAQDVGFRNSGEAGLAVGGQTGGNDL